MKPKYLRLKGFIGIKDGMGKDEIEIDLSNLNGLVVLSGMNGLGKTTVLECLLSYPEFISRRLNHLADNVFTRNAEWEYHFSYLENNYKTLVKIDNHTRNLEGFIYLNNAEKSETNGKISEYKKYINKVLGSSNMAYNSVFCAQNSTKISEMKEGDVRGLFREFVGADRLEEMSKTAGEVSKYFKKELEFQRNKLSAFDNIKADIEKIEGKDGTLETIHIQKAIIEDNEFNLVCYISENVCCVSHIQGQIYKNDVNRIEKENIEGKISDLKEIKEQNALDKQEKLVDIEMDIENDKTLSNVHKKTIAGKDNLVSLKEDLSTEKAILKERIESQSKISESIKWSDSMISINREEVGLLTKRKDVLQGEYVALREKHSLENAQLEGLKNSLNFSDGEYTAKINMANSWLNSLKEQVKPLETRPSNCVDDSCDFIKSALVAKDSIFISEDELSILKKNKLDKSLSIQQNIDSQKDIVDKVVIKGKTKSDEIKPILIDILSYEMALYHEKNYKTLLQKQLSNGEFKLNIANNHIASLKESIALIDENKITIAEHSLKVLVSNLADLEDQKGKINSLYDEKDLVTNKEIRHLSVKLLSFENEINYDQQLKDLEEEKIQFQKDEKRIQKELKALEISIGTNQNKLEELNKNLKNCEIIEEKIKKIEKEVQRWDFIKIQTGKKGLQAIEIESAVPLIVENANGLLRSSYGSGFSLKIITKDEETGKEIFDIVVIRDNGTETLLGNLSGGQQVYLIKALSLGMTLVSKNKSGHVFDSAFADEEDAKLDKKRASDFIKLYRAFLKLGQFQTMFFISHRDESIEVADHEIQFSEKGIEVI